MFVRKTGAVRTNVQQDEKDQARMPYALSVEMADYSSAETGAFFCTG
jgi:hypothetical protein